MMRPTDNIRIKEDDYIAPKEVVDQHVKLNEEIVAPQYLKILQESVDICSNTSKPDTFFSRYATAEEYAEKLSLLSTIKFSGYSPEQLKKQLRESKQTAIHDMIDRYFDSIEQKTAKYKDDRKKFEHYATFIIVLEDYFHLMNDTNINYVNSLYENAKSYLLDLDISTEKEYTTNKKVSVNNDVFSPIAYSIKENVFRNFKKYKTDLVAFHGYESGCCSECAKMIGRVYSVSGKNKIYPPLPEYVKNHGNFHQGCRCTMSPYFEGSELFHHGEVVNAIKSSTRPWIDDRTEHEINSYQLYIDTINKNLEREADRKEYELLLNKVPNIAPKSFGAYRKMKNSKSKNFEKLVTIANENGIEIK